MDGCPYQAAAYLWLLSSFCSCFSIVKPLLSFNIENLLIIFPAIKVIIVAKVQHHTLIIASFPAFHFSAAVGLVHFLTCVTRMVEGW